MLDVMQAVRNRRSIRRFTQEPLPREALANILEAARLAPTGVNMQPFQFAAVSRTDACHALFPYTAWARAIPDGSAGPTEATQPTAYIAILADKHISENASDTDAGAVGMSVLLAAEAQGIASCWLRNIRRKEILALLGLDAERFVLHSIVALGYPAMGAKAVPLAGNETQYYLESPDMLCVPKRAAEDVERWIE